MSVVVPWPVRAWLRTYHRLDVTAEPPSPTAPVLFVANHGFGSLFDLNVLAALIALDELDLDRDVTVLVHQLAWTAGLGPLLERLGCRPASTSAATEALASGRHVLVFPGGDIDAFKAHRDKDHIIFSGRSGFARLAIDAQVPLVPIVTSGAGDTLLVLSDGQGVARALQLDRLFRLKALPVSITAPWGLNLGIAGFLPYLAWPAKLRTAVLPPLQPTAGESADGLAARVGAVMQGALADLTR